MKRCKQRQRQKCLLKTDHTISHTSKVGDAIMTDQLICVFITLFKSNSLKVDDNCSSVKHDISSNIQS